MWSRLDDGLLDHRKVFIAGDLLGKDGPGMVLGMVSLGLMWTNKHLTDGHLPLSVVKKWPHFDQPIKVADALVKAGLWEKADGGFVIHDFHDHNFTAKRVQENRERLHAVRAQAGRNGGLKSGFVRRKVTKQ
jgi:hypothetical protein